MLISASLSSAAFLIISIAEFLASCKSLVSLAFLSASKLIALIALTALSRSELTVVRLVALPTASIPLFFSSSTCLISLDLASGSKSVLLISASLSSAAFLITLIARSLFNTNSFSALTRATSLSYSIFFLRESSKLIALIILTALSLSLLTPSISLALLTAFIPFIFSLLTCSFNFSLSTANKSALLISETFS